MSNGSDEDIEVVADGVRVRKGFEAEDFPVPAMRFAIASGREEPVSVRVVDQVPDSFSMEGIGFHPEYENENWTAYRDHRVAYERTLQPGEEVVTVYGIRATSMEEVEKFLDQPTVEVSQPPAGDAAEGPVADDRTLSDIAPEESTEVVREYLAGERESVPGMGESAAADSGGVELGGPEEGVTATEDSPSEFEASDDTPATEASGGEPAPQEPAEDVAQAAESDGGDEFDDLDLDDDDAEELLDDIDLGAESEPAEESADAAGDDLDLGFGEETAEADPATDDATGAGIEEATDSADAGADVDFGEPAAESEAPSESDAESLNFGDIPETDDLEAEESAGGGLDLESGPEEPAEESADAAGAPTEASPPGTETATPPTSEDTSGSGLDAEVDEPAASTDAGGPPGDAGSVDESSGDVPAGAIDEWQPGAAIAEADSVTGAIAEEVRRGDIAEEDIAELKDALGIATASGARSLKARMEHLESRVDEFDAYSAALEEFIDEHGAGRELVDEIEGRMQTMENTVNEVESTVEDVEDRVATFDDRLESLDESVDRLREDVDDVDERLENEMEAVQADLDAIEDDIAELSEWRSQLGEMFQ